MMWSYTFYFYPRPPRGGRRPIRTTTSAAIGFLSTPSARRATLLSGYGRVRDDISIHALREEGDGAQLQPLQGHTHFYPRPPRGGRPQQCSRSETSLPYFYPRPPRGGRPARLWLMQPSWTNFYPRPPRGGRRVQLVENIVDSEFLSTPSARRATVGSSIITAMR